VAMNRRSRPPNAARNTAGIWLAVLLALAALASQLYDRFQVTPGVTGTFAGAVHVIDGDSIRINGREMRLQGIDAPEGRQTCQRNGEDWRCGEAAAEALRRLTSAGNVTCEVAKSDQYDRGLATCRADGRNLNEAMVEDGFAVAYGRYETAEARAKAAGRGIWASQFERPRDWRRRNNIGG
jgi:endonuclease YncB( thermonuclease family)